MRSFAICSPDIQLLQSANPTLRITAIEGINVISGLVDVDQPDFDPETQPDHVLIRVRAFSCNYRDKSLILRMAARERSNSFYVIGSEFVAVVIEAGINVAGLAPGDRVIGNNAYPYSGVEALAPGVPTNHSSREMQVIHSAKLMRIPESMSDAAAASFSIGAQTTYSMVRRLGLADGDAVLVTAAKSNTSLFAIAALRQHKVNIYALSTSGRYADRLAAMGVHQLIVADPLAKPLVENPEIAAVVKQTGGFAGVIDPYSDLYLTHMPAIMAVGGRYISCGFYDQYLSLVGRKMERPPTSPMQLATLIMMKNLHVIGNCIGTTEDLARALGDHEAGHLPVQVDRVLGGEDTGAFLERTYNAADRFGKVVYAYD